MCLCQRLTSNVYEAVTVVIRCLWGLRKRSWGPLIICVFQLAWKHLRIWGNVWWGSWLDRHWHHQSVYKHETYRVATSSFNWQQLQVCSWCLPSSSSSCTGAWKSHNGNKRSALWSTLWEALPVVFLLCLDCCCSFVLSHQPSTAIHALLSLVLLVCSIRKHSQTHPGTYATPHLLLLVFMIHHKIHDKTSFVSIATAKNQPYRVVKYIVVILIDPELQKV